MVRHTTVVDVVVAAAFAVLQAEVHEVNSHATIPIQSNSSLVFLGIFVPLLFWGSFSEVAFSAKKHFVVFVTVMTANNTYFLLSVM